MSDSRAHDERLAFWLTPLAAAVPLVPLFSIPASPWFLGRLMGDPAHPMALPGTGPWLSAMGVVFDATILGYVMIYAMAFPIYRLFKAHAMILFCATGLLASQVVHFLQHFHQAGLREFADGWMSPLFGCVCGAAAGLFFAYCSRHRIPQPVRAILYPLPAAVLLICALAMVHFRSGSVNR
jgi:hypothetical protein